MSRWPKGRRYSLLGQPGCLQCVHWQEDPDTAAAMGICRSSAPNSPKRTTFTLEVQTCDYFEQRSKDFGMCGDA